MGKTTAPHGGVAAETAKKPGEEKERGHLAGRSGKEVWQVEAARTHDKEGVPGPPCFLHLGVRRAAPQTHPRPFSSKLRTPQDVVWVRLGGNPCFSTAFP